MILNFCFRRSLINHFFIKATTGANTDVFTGYKEDEWISAKPTHGHLNDTEAERGCEIIDQWITDWEREGRFDRVLRYQGLRKR